MIEKYPSSDDDSENENGEEMPNNAGRHANLRKLNQRGDIRHHNGKNRHPPVKKDALLKNNISQKGKIPKKTNIFMKQPNTAELHQPNLTPKPVLKTNPIAFLTNDKTIVNVPYHEVSHSQR
jgi:hypothetical protein